jgi:predicted phosphodiesterase
MRIALISDIHGNLTALETVIKALRLAAPDQVICLGDVAALGPNPREVIAVLRDFNWPVIMGNTDDWLLDPKPNPDGGSLEHLIDEIELWGAEQLTDEDRAYIRTFLPALELDLDDTRKLLCYHGSPRSYHDRILPTTPVERLDPWFAGLEAVCYAGGHTHERMVRSYQGGMLINPGSVGLPRIMQGNSVYNPVWAEYALIEWRGGCINIQLHCEAIDVDQLQKEAEASGMPHHELYCRGWRAV